MTIFVSSNKRGTVWSGVLSASQTHCHIHASRFIKPLDWVIPLDAWLLSSCIDRLGGNWRVWCPRGSRTSREMYFSTHRPTIQRVAAECEQLDIRTAITIEHMRIHVCWPRWNQVDGIARWRADRSAIIDRMSHVLALINTDSRAPSASPDIVSL